ncbi:MAG: asparaginase [Gemmatimonadaceae bacterium]
MRTQTNRSMLAAATAMLLSGCVATAQTRTVPAATTSAPTNAPVTAARTTGPLPKVLVVATGGTIAGVQDAPGTLGGYRAGALSVEQLLASVPELAKHAQMEAEQFSNVASPLITPEQWVALSKRINTVLRDRADIAGVVVTHGTDRLEETAFFLYLTVRSDKPVVVVGAQRPATGISPDGPINLLSAVRVAANAKSVGKGVMVVMDDRILSAREVRKVYQRTGGFTTGEMGMLGVVSAGGPDFLFTPVRRHGSTSEFDLTGIDSLPRVDLFFSYPGGTGPTFVTKPVGVVVATTGFTRAEGLAYRALRDSGVVVVTAFPSGDNLVVQSAPDAGGAAPLTATGTATTVTTGAQGAQGTAGTATAAPTAPMFSAQHLTPQKARILLMLALSQTRDVRTVQRFFAEY